MGALKSVGRSSSQELLHYYIERNDLLNIEKLIDQHPELLKSTISSQTKMTPLYQAVYNGNLQLTQLFVQRYHDDVNFQTQSQETPLVAAVKRNHYNIVSYLLKNNANPAYETGSCFKVIDFAILYGFYPVAFLLFQKLNKTQLKTPEQYYEISIAHHIRYVNYEVFLNSLEEMIEPENVKDFFGKNKKIFKDPVIDPRETWKSWFLRNLEFKDPPLVQRKQLPETLQPQNRKLGKIRTYLDRLTLSQNMQKPTYEIPKQSEKLESCNQMKKHQKMPIQLQSDNEFKN